MDRLDILCHQFIRSLEKQLHISLDIPISTLSDVLLHPSYAHENLLVTSYERLEFLGDSIANAIITKRLFEKFKDESEGTLSRLKAVLISTESFGYLAEVIELEKYLCVTGTFIKQETSKTMGRAFEALIGALFLALGFEQTSLIFNKIVECWENQSQLSWFDKERLLAIDVKSRLQEKLHAKGLLNPQYVMVEHHKKNPKDEFVMALMVNEKELGRAQGSSKKEAEKLVAKKILDNWSSIEVMTKKAE